MIQYGAVESVDLKFENFRFMIEPRESQWIDVVLRPQLSRGSKLPADIEELTALLICAYSGEIVQFVPQDEGRDCEYQFTPSEKEQLRQFYDAHVRPLLLQQISAGDTT
ncbi:hypothetical protein [Paenibacillus xerothermodurans]|uniref:Uncharacterized protein n=1 Tax=Paenibacillus xerothermodurans TaxID=1977292 RepID=A0A2W1NAS5_PAEXE|nr:hypothetical protein [Paenibacillus xerothermodurans]PZE21789.1 hypothetical protein CBW46_005105 [Paenibacillus xerothermodurans]